MVKLNISDKKSHFKSKKFESNKFQKLNDLINELNINSNKKKAEIHQRFFKTGKGQYGEGDIFIGLTMPQIRNIIKNYPDLILEEIQSLLDSKIHEYRMSGLLILNKKFEKSQKIKNLKNQQEIYNLYIKNYKNINNWDLVDLSAPNILGNYLLNKDKAIIYDFARSNHLWKKRIAMISCLTFIRNNDFSDTLKISRILLYDDHDLIHKATGWMLREIGKRNQEVEEKFLIKYYKTMPRTTLRYAIERFSKSKREFYMKK